MGRYRLDSSEEGSVKGGKRDFFGEALYHSPADGGNESNKWKAKFDYGRKDYFLGNHPLWQVFRSSIPDDAPDHTC